MILGAVDIDDIKLGVGSISKVYLGAVEVWPVGGLLVSDSFAGADSTTLNGRTPDTTNVPGYDWQHIKLTNTASFPTGDIFGNQARIKPDATGALIRTDELDVIVEADWYVADSSARGYLVLRHDGINPTSSEAYCLTFAVRQPNADVRIRLGATTLSSAAFSFTIGQTYRIKATVDGMVVRAYVDGVQVLSAIAGSTARPANTFHGIMRATATDAMRFDNFEVNHASRRLADKNVIVVDGTLTDCDSMSWADMTGNGKPDMLSSQASGTKSVNWYEQGATAKDWTKHVINNDATALAGGEVEGLTTTVIGGVRYVFAALQDNGKILIHTPTTPGDPTGAWTDVELKTGRPWMMNLFAYDIDGDGVDEIIFSWEGTSAGTGGINWLDFTGSDPMNPADWDEYVICQHPGAFWALREFIDISGSGRGDMVFSARNETGRNPNCVPGVYWLARPATVTDVWTKTTIDSRNKDWHKCITGNFFGDGHSLDVIACDVDGNEPITAYRFSSSWARTSITSPSTNHVWNLSRIPSANGLGTNGRDAFIAAILNSYIYTFQWSGSAWVATALDYYPTQGHPLDNIILWTDVDGDGVDEALIADSSTQDSKLVWIRVKA